jgi:hypothetical protein
LKSLGQAPFPIPLQLACRLTSDLPSWAPPLFQPHRASEVKKLRLGQGCSSVCEAWILFPALEKIKIKNRLVDFRLITPCQNSVDRWREPIHPRDNFHYSEGPPHPSPDLPVHLCVTISHPVSPGQEQSQQRGLEASHQPNGCHFTVSRACGQARLLEVLKLLLLKCTDSLLGPRIN